MTFGEKLRELREAKGLTREALATASGVPFGTIHGYEIDRRAPSLGTTIRLANALGVDCTVFSQCEGLAEPRPEPEPPPAPKRKSGKK